MCRVQACIYINILMSAQFPSSNKEYSCYIAIFADTLFNVHAYFFSQLRGTLHEFQMNY
jgi:hypothetical protein